MNRIIKTDGAEVCLVDEVRYIKRSRYGVFIEADPSDAIAICVNGTVYNLLGHNSIVGAETVLVSKVSTADVLSEQVKMANIAFVALAEAGTIDEATSAKHAEYFDEWVFPKAYNVGKILRSKGKLFKCLQSHTSQEGWEPENTPALWKQIGNPSEEYPQWVQPICAIDAYSLGAKVSNDGAKWTSDYDNNVWEPGVYGWTKESE